MPKHERLGRTPRCGGRDNLATQALVATYAATKAIVDESSARAAVTDITTDCRPRHDEYDRAQHPNAPESRLHPTCRHHANRACRPIVGRGCRGDARPQRPQLRTEGRRVGKEGVMT